MNTWDLTSGSLHQPWQLWTCHLVHQDWQHAANDVLAFSVPVLLAPRHRWMRNALALLVIAPVLGLLLMGNLEGGRYCGLSGVVCALWAMVGWERVEHKDSRWIGVVLLVSLALKLGLESMTGWSLIDHDGKWQTLTASHVIGTLLGLITGASGSEISAMVKKTHACIKTKVLKQLTVPR